MDYSDVGMDITPLELACKAANQNTHVRMRLTTGRPVAWIVISEEADKSVEPKLQFGHYSSIMSSSGRRFHGEWMKTRWTMSQDEVQVKVSSQVMT